ncbi:MAG: hypothetical protein HOH19_11815, partial [Kordiimonadaceae bacterium]|nr:hypothetical protein [Kordiimonadaceae bacterium]
MIEHKQGKTDITLIEAMAPLVTMFLAFVIGGLFVPIGAEFLIMALLLSAAVAAIFAGKYNHGWKDIQRAAGQKISGA